MNYRNEQLIIYTETDQEDMAEEMTQEVDAQHEVISQSTNQSTYIRMTNE